MNLRKRINKLQQQNREITVKQYCLFKLDKYDAKEVVINFWVGLSVAMLVGLFVLWCASGIISDIKRDADPQAIKAQMDKDNTQAENERKSKDQYVQACKDAGKAPGDMGNSPHTWSCV